MSDTIQKMFTYLTCLLYFLSVSCMLLIFKTEFSCTTLAPLTVDDPKITHEGRIDARRKDLKKPEHRKGDW